MLISFEGSKGIIRQELFAYNQNITGKYYLGIMDRRWKGIVLMRLEYRVN